MKLRVWKDFTCRPFFLPLTIPLTWGVNEGKPFSCQLFPTCRKNIAHKCPLRLYFYLDGFWYAQKIRSLRIEATRHMKNCLYSITTFFHQKEGGVSPAFLITSASTPTPPAMPVAGSSLTTRTSLPTFESLSAKTALWLLKNSLLHRIFWHFQIPANSLIRQFYNIFQ